VRRFLSPIASRLSPRLVQFIKFCCVGGSGFIVDMTLLYLLADPKCLALNVTLSKVLAAETAILNNFIWNEFWTFRSSAHLKSQIPNGKSSGTARRFLTFNAICGIGIGLAVLLLHLFHGLFGWNMYVSNLLAIIAVTFWNFGMNAKLNWSAK
jgi:dolichol-phosphate mannosyltransferase